MIINSKQQHNDNNDNYNNPTRVGEGARHVRGAERHATEPRGDAVVDACMCIYIYIHTHLYTYVGDHIYTCLHAYMHAYIDIPQHNIT